MIRTAIGAAVGWAAGFAAGYAAEFLTSPAGAAGSPNRGALFGVLASTGGATAGAVIGGVGDILAFLRKTFPPRGRCPEADYHDPRAAP